MSEGSTDTVKVFDAWARVACVIPFCERSRQRG